MTSILHILAIIGLFSVIERIVNMLRSKTVYIIDDDPVSLAMLEAKLKSSRFKVRCFSSVKGVAPKIALAVPDFVIVDYDLNDSITGENIYDFCTRHGIPVAIYTATPEAISSEKRVFSKMGSDPLGAVSNFLKTV